MSSIDMTKGLITKSVLQILGEEVTSYMNETCKAVDKFVKTGKGGSREIQDILCIFDMRHPYPEIHRLFYKSDRPRQQRFLRWVKQ